VKLVASVQFVSVNSQRPCHNDPEAAGFASFDHQRTVDSARWSTEGQRSAAEPRSRHVRSRPLLLSSVLRCALFATFAPVSHACFQKKRRLSSIEIGCASNRWQPEGGYIRDQRSIADGLAVARA